MEKLAILQSIYVGIILIKSNETRVLTYTPADILASINSFWHDRIIGIKLPLECAQVITLVSINKHKEKLESLRKN